MPMCPYCGVEMQLEISDFDLDVDERNPSMWVCPQCDYSELVM